MEWEGKYGINWEWNKKQFPNNLRKKLGMDLEETYEEIRQNK